MAPVKLLNLLAVTSLAILATSFGPSPVNALSVDSNHYARHPVRAHATIAKKKRGTGKRCKDRPTSGTTQSNGADNSPKAEASSSPTPQPNGGNTGGSTGGNTGAQAPPPASSPPPSPVPAPSPPSTGGGKAGLAWPNGDEPGLANFKTAKTKYIYTWSPFIPSSAKSLGFEVVPMLWGDKQIWDFQQLVKQGYANTVLGFNEPNQSGQSDMSPQHGAQLWKQYIQPLKAQGYRLISPACTSAPSGKTWMADFFAACDGCTFDALAIHYYDISPQGFIDYITDFHNTFKLPIWATEFACQNFNGGAQCTNDEVFNFADKVVKFMDATDWVEAYFPFGAMRDMQGVNGFNQLMTNGGALTDLAHVYF